MKCTNRIRYSDSARSRRVCVSTRAYVCARLREYQHANEMSVYGCAATTNARINAKTLENISDFSIESAVRDVADSVSECSGA